MYDENGCPQLVQLDASGCPISSQPLQQSQPQPTSSSAQPAQTSDASQNQDQSQDQDQDQNQGMDQDPSHAILRNQQPMHQHMFFPDTLGGFNPEALPQQYVSMPPMDPTIALMPQQGPQPKAHAQLEGFNAAADHSSQDAVRVNVFAPNGRAIA